MISQAAWRKYIGKLAAIDKKAADQMRAWADKNGLTDDDALIRYAYGLATKYGEASATLSCEMYDAMSGMMKAVVPDALPAETATYEEVAKGVMWGKYHSPSQIPSIVGRQVRLAGADTMMKNAGRDQAEWAWVPQGDTCAFCITLASNGWQKASSAVLRGGHADHIHQNCDCTFAIAFKEKDKKQYDRVYDPQKYRDMYYGAEGNTPNERINSMRREKYTQDAPIINARKRELYVIKQTGGHYYIDKEEDSKRDKQANRAYEKYCREDDSKRIAMVTGFSVQDIQRIRSHVFFKKHDRNDNRYDRFDPSYDMAVAWKRLREGKPLPRDITLLKHELLESEVEQKYNLTASEAHKIADQQYGWCDQLMAETDEKGEPDGLL